MDKFLKNFKNDKHSPHQLIFKKLTLFKELILKSILEIQAKVFN